MQLFESSKSIGGTSYILPPSLVSFTTTSPPLRIPSPHLVSRPAYASTAWYTVSFPSPSLLDQSISLLQSPINQTPRRQLCIQPSEHIQAHEDTDSQIWHIPTGFPMQKIVSKPLKKPKKKKRETNKKETKKKLTISPTPPSPSHSNPPNSKNLQYTSPS